MLTPVQIRVARTILRWSARELAEQASLDISTIKRMEREDSVVRVRDETVQKTRAAFEAAGIYFTSCANGDPGVRFTGQGRNGQASLSR